MIDNLIVPFRELNGRGIRVAIVDSGIDPSHPLVGPIAGGVGLIQNGSIIEANDTFLDDYGHGTAAAALVRKFAPGTELISIKISRGTEAIPAPLLARGIQEALDRGADIINVSAGTTGTTELAEITAVCERARAANVIVVAAESNEGVPTYPAALESVLSVDGGFKSIESFAYSCDPDRSSRISIYGGYQKVAWTNPRYLFTFGTSFAAPRVSAMAALITQRYGRMPRERLLEILLANARSSGSRTAGKRVTKPVTASSNEPAMTDARSIKFIKKAALYPFSKEMHSLIRFRHMLPFEVVGIADPVTRGSAGKDAGEVLHLAPIGLTVTPKLDEALANADTLILGYTRTLAELQGRDIGLELAKRAIDLGKNVYSFEPFNQPHHAPLMLEAAQKGLTVTWPGVELADLEELRRDAAEAGDYSNTPLLGVFGTSPSQGKFTLQLILRDHLQKRGFKVASFGSEHQSALFGMEDCFPIGHVNNVNIPIELWREYFDRRYKKMAKENEPELIINGSQSGIVPYTLDGAGSLTALNVLYLMATRGDSFILVVNHMDEDQFIQDHIDSLRIFGHGRTIALALSDQKRKLEHAFGRARVLSEPVGPEEQREHIQRLEAKFGIPVVSILDGERLADVVVAAYAESSAEVAHV